MARSATIERNTKETWIQVALIWTEARSVWKPALAFLTIC